MQILLSGALVSDLCVTGGSFAGNIALMDLEHVEQEDTVITKLS